MHFPFPISIRYMRTNLHCLQNVFFTNEIQIGISHLILVYTHKYMCIYVHIFLKKKIDELGYSSEVSSVFLLQILQQFSFSSFIVLILSA